MVAKELEETVKKYKGELGQALDAWTENLTPEAAWNLAGAAERLLETLNA